MQINKAEITVVIPMYNSESTIIGVLNSICSQTQKEYLKEIIGVNDGSRDGSSQMVEKYAQNSNVPIVVINKENGGVSSARNVGMKKASGSWIAFCDADDVWCADKIEKQVEIINSYKVDLLGGNYSDVPIRLLFKTIDSIHKVTIKELCIKMFPYTSTIIMRKNILTEIGGFDENQKYAEDGNFFMKIAAKYNYYYSPAKMICYGGGKRGFGVSGLSANLKGMHEGNLKNLREVYDAKFISFQYYVLMRIFYELKYIRRRVIVKLEKRVSGR